MQKEQDHPATCALCGGDHSVIYKGCDYFRKHEAQHANKRPVAQRYTPHLSEQLPAIPNHHSRNYAQALRGVGTMTAIHNAYICCLFSQCSRG